MMYATAQRVRAATESGPRTGVNVFLFEGTQPFPTVAAGHADIEAIAGGEYAGDLTLVDHSEELVSGGNAVVSYLDVAAVNGVAAETVIERLEAAEGDVAMSDLPRTWYSEKALVSFRFSAVGMSGEYARREFVALASRLAAQLRRATDVGDPFVLRLTRGADGWDLAVEPAARTRLLGAGFHPSAGIHVAYDMHDDFVISGLPGPLVAHLVTPATGAELGELVRQGGVKVLEGERVIWQRLPR
jgi:hypothetical protein